MITAIVNWINRHITHNRDREGDFGIRVLLHIPIGFLMGLLPFMDNALKDLFLKYERNEDLHTEDQAWKDIFGAIVGFSVGRIISAGVVVYIVYIILKHYLGG